MFYTPFDSVKNSLKDLWLDIENDKRQFRETLCCKQCKTSLEDFLETGFVGCANCYKTFESYAREFALDIHGRASHIGKVPKAEATKAMKKRELESLINEKEKAVREENYILADELKTKIARLREEL